MDSKPQLRHTLRAQRRALSARKVITNSSRIADNLIECVDWSSLRKVHIYQSISTENEVKTDEITSYISENWPHINITLAVSYANAALPGGSFNLVIVPLLGFDNHNHRIGFGGGWYDRFLATQANAITIGLAYEIQRVDNVPHEAHDVPIDIIITESQAHEI